MTYFVMTKVTSSFVDIKQTKSIASKLGCIDHPNVSNEDVIEQQIQQYPGIRLTDISKSSTLYLHSSHGSDGYQDFPTSCARTPESNTGPVKQGLQIFRLV